MFPRIRRNKHKLNEHQPLFFLFSRFLHIHTDPIAWWIYKSSHGAVHLTEKYAKWAKEHEKRSAFCFHAIPFFFVGIKFFKLIPTELFTFHVSHTPLIPAQLQCLISIQSSHESRNLRFYNSCTADLNVTHTMKCHSIPNAKPAHFV